MQEPGNVICDSTPPATSPQKFLPQWHGPIEGYAKNQIRHLLPRVRHFTEYDDLLQEAFEVYLFCRMRYTTVDNAAWFMSLFKRVLYSRHAKLVVSAAPWLRHDEFEQVHEDLLVEWCDGLLSTVGKLEELIPWVHARATKREV